MLNCLGTTDKLQVIRSSAADLHTLVSFVEATLVSGVLQNDTMVPDSEPHAFTASGTDDVLAAPAANRVRNPRFMSFRNAHASTACDVTVQWTDGTTTVQLIKVTLSGGEELVWNEGGTWFVHEVASGGVKTAGLTNATDTVPGLIEIADQTEMEAGADAAKAVTPARQHYHPSAAKFWVDANGSGVGVNASYNITSLTDTGVGRLGVNINQDFSSVNYSIQCTVERTVTALTATGVEDTAIRNASQAAGVFEIECYDHTATTMAAQDPASYYAVGYGDI